MYRCHTTGLFANKQVTGKLGCRSWLRVEMLLGVADRGRGADRGVVRVLIGSAERGC